MGMRARVHGFRRPAFKNAQLARGSEHSTVRKYRRGIWSVQIVTVRIRVVVFKGAAGESWARRQRVVGGRTRSLLLNGSHGGLLSLLGTTGGVDTSMASQLIGSRKTLFTSRKSAWMRLLASVCTNMTSLMFKAVKALWAHCTFVRSRYISLINGRDRAFRGGCILSKAQ
jgi:hypothetical protein